MLSRTAKGVLFTALAFAVGGVIFLLIFVVPRIDTLFSTPRLAADPTATAFPTITPFSAVTAAPTALPTIAPSPACPQEGRVIWEVAEGETLSLEEPVALVSTESSCWLVGEVWTDTPTLRQWAFAVAPNTPIVMVGIRGGIAWLVTAKPQNIAEIVAAHVVAMERVHPGVPTAGVVLPEDREQFPIARIEPPLSP